MKAIRQVLHYVKAIKDYEITYKHNRGNKIHGFSDSSYGVNTQEGKGTTGIIFYYREFSNQLDLFNHNASVAAAVAAINSDSHDDSATVACFCVLQLIGEFSIVKYYAGSSFSFLSVNSIATVAESMYLVSSVMLVGAKDLETWVSFFLKKQMGYRAHTFPNELLILSDIKSLRYCEWA
nr:ribonuclease H-like domain, reverse transcriptase, RNA-dependent DNA polymerase [Tanacetum cinerariifolium]